MNKLVFEKLKQVAREEKVITYSQLILECNLDLDMNQIKDRNELAKILGEISESEVLQGRPMLSAVVVLKNSQPISPAFGFYSYADELKVRKKEEKDNQLFFGRVLGECFTYWKAH